MLEAMSCGVLCVASDVSGVRDVISDDEIGFVVPPSKEHDLAKALIDVIKITESRRKNMGLARDSVSLRRSLLNHLWQLMTVCFRSVTKSVVEGNSIIARFSMGGNRYRIMEQ